MAYRRYYRRYRRRRYNKRAIRNQIGYPRNKSTSKRIDSVFTTNLISTATLYSHDMTAVQRGDQLNDRARDIINVSGFKIKFLLHNLVETAMSLNVAVLSPRSQDASEDTILPGAFFRAGNGDRRYNNFNTSELIAPDYHFSEINSDKYLILMHKRFLLGPSDLSGAQPIWNAPNRDNFKVINQWVPLRRQVRYRAELLDTPQDGKVYVVYWMSPLGTDGNVTPTGNAGQLWLKCTMFFRDQTN